MKNIIRTYLEYPLEAYESNFEQRLFIYLSYGFLVGITTFVSLNILGFIRGYPVIQAFQGMYSWHTTLNFTLCLVLVAKVFRFVRWKSTTQKAMKIIHLLLIGMISFVIAYFLQRTIVYAGVKNYNPSLIEYYTRYPDARPGVTAMLAWCLFFWVPVYLVLTKLAIWKQNRYEQYFDSSKQSTTKRWVLDGGKVMINIDDILHISMEDHYAKIWWQRDKQIFNEMVRLSMKEIVKQLSQNQFFQIHRSHLINVEHIEGLVRKNQRWVVNIGRTELPVSRTRLSSLRDKLHGETNL